MISNVVLINYLCILRPLGWLRQPRWDNSVLWT